MWNIIFYYYLIIALINQIKSDDDISLVLSNTGIKGVAVTSFSKDLYLISSNKIYNIINENFHPIKTNLNDNINSGTQFFKNFEALEASINLNTNESVFLIAENRGSGNRINLYSFNVSLQINENNPNLLSYIINENCYESIWFKYTYYEGFEILKTFNINYNNDINDSIIIKIITGMSCF